MNVIKFSGAAVALGLGVVTVSLPVQSNIWVFEPSIALDQRFDDNYLLLPNNPGTLAATRLVGDVGLSRESEVTLFRGRIRADALVTTQNEAGQENADFNGLVAFDVKRRAQRSRYGLTLSLKADTPNRDIAADISEEGSLASDTGLNITQSYSNNVARTEIVVKPNFQFDVTRRLVFDSSASISSVGHELPSAQDAIYQYYTVITPDDVELPYDQVNINTVGQFTVSGELDDYVEGKAEMGVRYNLTPISTVTASIGYSRFIADVDSDARVNVPESEKEPDDEIPFILRNPRRESIATTNRAQVGYERFLKPNLQLALAGGVYTNTTDNTDTMRLSDNVSLQQGQTIASERSLLLTETDGWLASIGLTFDSGTTRYITRFAVDVQPSSAGAQVETQELTGELFRILSPRTTFNFKARAYEPDRLGANASDRFARRFISFEPKLQWRFSRNWTLTTAYRYRRQKARIDNNSAESNAILAAIKYTPPSEIRDAANASGL